MPDQGSDLPDTDPSIDGADASFGGRDLNTVPPLWTFDNGPGFTFQPTGGFGDHTTQAIRYAIGLDDPSGVTDPTMLASIRQFQPIDSAERAYEPSGAKEKINPYFVAQSAQHSVGGAGPLVSKPGPSSHAGHYGTLDDAAKAATSDVPPNTLLEYGAYLPERYVTQTIDFGDGFGPQSVSHVDGYDYGGLRTSGNPGAVTLGSVPPHLGGWFHNHPKDLDDDLNLKNRKPSPGASGDAGVIDQFHRHNTPLMETYILGPDNILRKFWSPSDPGEVLK